MPDTRTIPQLSLGPTGDSLPDSEQLAVLQWLFEIQESGYGPATQAKVAALQREHGIPVDPQVMIGPRSWALVVDLYNRKVEQMRAPVPQLPPGPVATQLPTAEQVAFIHWLFDVEEEGYGPKTQERVAALQRENQIEVDPQVMIGPRTWTLLEELYHVKAGEASPTGWTPPARAYQGNGSTAEEVWLNEQLYRLNTQVVPGTAARYVCNRRILALLAASTPPIAEVPTPATDDPEVVEVINQLVWTQAKLDRLWEWAGQVCIDPRVMLAVLFQEGTGSFNTNADVPVQWWTNGRYVQGGSGPQPDFEKDLEAALSKHIFAKVVAYGYYAMSFQQAVQAAGLGDGNLFQYVNWITPWYKPSGWIVRPGPYATHTVWWKGLQHYFDTLCGEGATQAYSRYMAGHPASVASPPPAVAFRLTYNGTTDDDRVGGQPWIEAFQPD